MKIRDALPVAWMSASVLLALWVGYAAGGVLLQYPNLASKSGRQLPPASGTAGNSEPQPESPAPQRSSQTIAKVEAPPASRAPQPPAEAEPPSSEQPTRETILRHGVAGSGNTVLQVAALTRNADATALAEAMQKKGFPAFVLTPTTDRFYRVQIGPFPDRQSAGVTGDKLQAQGFQVFMKHQ